jgi:hypothetical protein
MLSHAPLCGINRPHVRHWSRTNRIDPILELLPVTSDTVAVPPPTRSPEPKVTRYIVIRNDQHDGSAHHGKIFIVAGNRLAVGHLPGKPQLHSVTIRPPPGSVARARGRASRSRGEDFRRRPAGARPRPRRDADPSRRIRGTRPMPAPLTPPRTRPVRPMRSAWAPLFPESIQHHGGWPSAAYRRAEHGPTIAARETDSSLGACGRNHGNSVS